MTLEHRLYYRRIWQILRLEGLDINKQTHFPFFHFNETSVNAAGSVKGFVRAVFTSTPGCAELELADGCRHGYTGPRSHDQIPDLRG